MSLSPAHKRLHAAVGCLLYDQRYRGRFLTLKTINSLFNKLSPCGKIINRFTCQNAFTIKGGPSYCEYNIYEKLHDVLDCSEGTILAVRRVQRADPTKGYLTAVGCFDFQLCYLAILLLKTVKKKSNGATLKMIYRDTMFKVLQDKKYADSAKESFIQAWDELLAEVEAMELADDVEPVEDMRVESLGLEELLLDEVDSDEEADADEEDRSRKQQQREQTKQKIAQLAAECPTNVKDPNFSRWGTISAVAKVVLKHWLPLLYMSQNIIDVEKNGSYLHTIATNNWRS